MTARAIEQPGGMQYLPRMSRCSATPIPTGGTATTPSFETPKAIGAQLPAAAFCNVCADTTIRLLDFCETGFAFISFTFAAEMVGTVAGANDGGQIAASTTSPEP